MKLFLKGVSHGAAWLVILCSVLASVSSQLTNGSSLSGSQNGTVLNDINATGEMLKRVGEFASRTLWVRNGKLIFPKGTILTLAPKITVPAFRKKAFKGGLNSDVQATWYFYINCDKLGFTHDMHPFPFDRPPFYPFGPLMRPIGDEKEEDKKDDKNKNKEQKPAGGPPTYPENQFYHYQPHIQDSYKNANSDAVYTFFPIHKRLGGGEQNGAKRNIRKPRSVMSLPPPDKLPGGERAVVLPSIENLLSDFGFEGRGCMLRAICEIHEFPLQQGYGLFGEMIALFFSVSQSPYAESHMPQYLKAEESGRRGDCSEYKKVCAKSIFRWEVERKRHDDDVETNDIPSSPFRSKFEDDEL